MRTPSLFHRVVDRIALPLRHDPAWFELVSVMGGIGWSVLGLLSARDFDEWPSMMFVSLYLGDGALHISLLLAIAQGFTVFVWPITRARTIARGVIAFLFSWWWCFLGMGILSTLPGLSMHSALYMVVGLVNLMVMGRLAIEAGDERIREARHLSELRNPPPR